MVYLIIGFIIGFFLGAIVLYLDQEKKLKAANQKLQQARILLDESEVANNQKLQQARLLLDESEVANREHANELQKLKQEQNKINQLQEEQRVRQDQLQSSYKEELRQLEVMARTKLQELESTYNSRLEVLELEREEDLREIEQYEKQMQALIQEGQIPVFLGEDGVPVEEVEEIESLLDLFSDLGTETELEAGTTDSVKAQENITAITASNSATAVPQLIQYTYEPDSKIRALVATKLGEIAEGKSQGIEIERIVLSLGKLSRDIDPIVRQAAIDALGKIGSIKVIPLLKIAQRDTDSDVVKSASSALEQFKGYRTPKKKKVLPKNASAVVE